MSYALKHILLLLCALAAMGSAFGQAGYYYSTKKEGDKYFVSLGFGEGTAHWNSVFKSTDFYDKDGKVINKGDLEFNANSPTKHYDINVLAPIGHIRLGLGISFEQHYLSQLKIYSKGGEEYLLFDESLRFDKAYFHSEVPFKYNTKKNYSFNWNFRFGWFGYTNVKRFNFIGDKPFPIALHAESGITADYEIYPHVYIYVFPNIAYKYYNNSRSEAPVDITHSVFTACVIGGLRVDMGKLKN